MRWLLGSLLVLLVLGAVAYPSLAERWAEANKPEYRTLKARQRTLTVVVNSTGEVKPVLSVSVGAFVSGPIEELHIDFNDRVEVGQLLAEIDTRIYDAAVARDRATLITRRADVRRARAQLQQAINDEKRSVALREESPDFISQAEIDQFHFARMSLEAQLEVAQAAVEQAKANLDNSTTNLSFTLIRSPVDGIVIDRKIDPGQTLVAQFQTPELFTIAPDMDKKMHIFASVDEADIGLIRKAQEDNQPVEFTVDAYPADDFIGHIEQIRFSSTETQNVVTYPVVVSAPNPELKLLPGMTADLSFTIERREGVVCVPNAAVRFYPGDKSLVREEDHALLEAPDDDETEDDDVADDDAATDETDEEPKRHVWVPTDDGLRAIEVKLGVSDNRYTEVLSGEIESGIELVTAKK